MYKKKCRVVKLALLLNSSKSPEIAFLRPHFGTCITIFKDIPKAYQTLECLEKLSINLPSKSKSKEQNLCLKKYEYSGL